MMYSHVEWRITDIGTEIIWKEIVLSYINLLHISTHLITKKVKFISSRTAKFRMEVND